MIGSDLSATVLEALAGKEYPEWHILEELPPLFRYYRPTELKDIIGDTEKND